MFASRYLHFIDHRGLSVWRRQGNHMECLERFFESERSDSIADFASWIAKHSGAIHYILLDLPDEGFYVEQIPPVSGRDRKGLIERRQLQQFFGTPYATAISLGRNSEGRRDERVLLIALTRPEALEPWLDCLRKAEARLAAVGSVSLLTGQLLGFLQPDSPLGLILSFSPSGIRQTYFEQGALRFSRLSPTPEGDFCTWGEACLREAQKTAQYLTAQRWIARDTNLPVWLLARREDFSALAGHIGTANQLGNRLDFRLASIDAIAHQAGMHSEFLSSDSTALMMHLALRSKGSLQFAPDSDRRFFQYWCLRNAIACVGACVGIGLAAVALSNHREAHNLEIQNTLLQAEMQSDQNRFQQLLERLPAMPTNLETLQGLVDEHTRLLANRTHPEETLKRISHALDLYPEISLRSLAWQPEGSANQPGKTETSLNTKVRQIFILGAVLNENEDDARAAIARIQSFSEELQRQTGAELAGIKMPFDSEPDKTLHSDAIVLQQHPGFEIRLRMPESLK